MFKKNKVNKQKGGDGYVINVNEAIGGLPAFSRYSNNYRPIFDGELLQNGGDGYSVDPAIDIGGMPGVVDYKECKLEDNLVGGGSKKTKNNKQHKQTGGDGYSVDPDIDIGGMPGVVGYKECKLEDTLVGGGSKKTKKNKQHKQTGGDGYSIDPSSNFDGMPVVNGYTYNHEPIFEGSLLSGGSKKTKKNKQHKQTGGDGYSIDPSSNFYGMPVVNRYTYNDTPVFDGSLLSGGSKKTKNISIYKFLKMQAGGGGCGCDASKTEDPSIFNLIKMSGGMKDYKKTQFHAIKEIASLLVPLSTKSLLSLNSKIFLNNLSEKKPVKYKQLGGYVDQIESILAPLGKNNLLVLAGLLLLHHFAVDSQKKSTKELKGGNPLTSSLSEILAPLGVNTLGSSLLLILLQKSFVGTKSVSRESSKNSKNSKILLGGNPLQNLIAPLGNNAFIATGLLIVLERLFVNKINESKTKDKEKKVLIGGKVNKKYEELFNLISPITFNIFAKESFLINYAKKNLKNKSKK